MILNAGKSKDMNCDRQEAEERQVEPGPAPEDENSTIAPVLKDVIANEVRFQVENALAAIQGILTEAVEQLLMGQVEVRFVD